MSQSSAYGRIIGRRAGEWQGGAPVDALGAYVATSNLHHHLDIFAGEVAAWSAADSSELRTPIADPGERPTFMLSSGRFFAVVDELDAPYRYRVRVAGRSTNGDPVAFYVAVLPAVTLGVSAAAYLDPAEDPTAIFETSSATAAWIAGAQYSVGPSRRALVSGESVQSTRTGPSGKPTAAHVTALHVVVYGERTGGTSGLPELHALHVAAVRG